MAIPAVIASKSTSIKSDAKGAKPVSLYLVAFTLGENSVFLLPESAMTTLLYTDPAEQFRKWKNTTETNTFSPNKPVALGSDWKYQGIKIEKGVVTELEKDHSVEVYPGIVWSPKLTKGQPIPNLDSTQTLTITESLSQGTYLFAGVEINKSDTVSVSLTPEKAPQPIAKLHWKQTPNGGILSLIPTQDGMMLQGEAKFLKEVSRYVGQLHLLQHYFGEGVKYLAQDVIQTIMQGESLENSVVDLTDDGLKALMERTAFNAAKLTRKSLTGVTEDSLGDRKRLAQIKQNLPISF